VLSLGAFQFLSVWDQLYRLPFFNSVIQARIAIISILCIAVLASIGIEVVADASVRWSVLSHVRNPLHRCVTVIGGVGVTLAGIVALWPSVPLGVQDISAPAWFARHGSSLPPRSVILPNPPAFSLFENSLAWQALDSMKWSQPGISGPQAIPSRAGAEGPAVEILQRLATGVADQQVPTRFAISQVREAIRLWGVTRVVVPRSFGPSGVSAAPAAAFYTAALGRLPESVDNAWTWAITPKSWNIQQHNISRSNFINCVTKYRHNSELGALPRCILD
jgi:hypothetical protein